MRRTVPTRRIGRGTPPAPGSPRAARSAPRRLPARRAAFLGFYLSGPPGVRGNATQAAIRAGYAPRSARQVGARLLTKADIRRVAGKALEEAGITQQRALDELAATAFARASDVVSWGPSGVTVRPSSELTDAQIAGVASVEQHETTGEHSTSRHLKIKQHDKIAALTLLAKYLKLVDQADTPANLAERTTVNIFIQQPDGTVRPLREVEQAPNGPT